MIDLILPVELQRRGWLVNNVPILKIKQENQSHVPLHLIYRYAEK